ncbi:MAG: hypothetical protein AAGI12_06960 [Pseudomonadota bacterium]
MACPDAVIADRLRFIDARPEIVGLDAETQSLDLEVKDDLMRANVLDGYKTEGCSKTILADLHQYHYRESRAEFPSSPLVHAASIEMSGGMVLFVGDKGAGKSTLICALGLSGAKVLGDEHVILAGGKAITRPRTMRIKTGSLQWLPHEFCNTVSVHHCITDWHGFRIFSVPPSVFGSPWVLSWMPVRAVVMLKPNHGGASSMRRITADEATPRLFENGVLPSQNRVRGLGDLRMLLTRTTLVELRVGCLEHACRLMYAL